MTCISQAARGRRGSQGNILRGGRTVADSHTRNRIGGKTLRRSRHTVSANRDIGDLIKAAGVRCRGVRSGGHRGSADRAAVAHIGNRALQYSSRAYRDFPHAAPVRGDAQDAIGILNRHVKDSYARQPIAECRPRGATVGRTIHADVRAGVKETGVRRIDDKSVDRNIWNCRADAGPGRRRNIQICRLVDVGGRTAKIGCQGYIGGVLIVWIDHRARNVRRGNCAGNVGPPTGLPRHRAEHFAIVQTNDTHLIVLLRDPDRADGNA